MWRLWEILRGERGRTRKLGKLLALLRPYGKGCAPLRLENDWMAQKATLMSEKLAVVMADAVGLTARFAVMPFAIPGACIDPARMHAIAGRTTVGWRAGWCRGACRCWSRQP